MHLVQAFYLVNTENYLGETPIQSVDIRYSPMRANIGKLGGTTVNIVLAYESVWGLFCISKSQATLKDHYQANIRLGFACKIQALYLIGQMTERSFGE